MFAYFIEETATLSGVVGELVKELSSQLFTITDPAVLNENFKNDNVNSLRHRLAGTPSSHNHALQ